MSIISIGWVRGHQRRVASAPKSELYERSFILVWRGIDYMQSGTRACACTMVMPA